jgi:competence protein ComEC
MLLIIFLMGMFSYEKFYPFFLIFFCSFELSIKQISKCIVIFIFGYCLILNHESRIKTQIDQFDHNYFSSFLVKVIGFEEKKSYGKRWKVSIIQPFSGQVWVYCFQQCPLMYPGETWWIQGKIKKITVLHNPGQLDFWYQSNYRHLIGQIMMVPGKHKKEADIGKFDLLNQIRVSLYQKVNQAFNHQHDFSKRLFLTLVLGIGSELSNDDWQIFKDTGTAHLMVVSGAHLGLLMLMIAWIVEQCYRFKMSLIPAKKIASAISLLVGLIYALISGFGIPVQRAWLMKFFFDLKYWFNFRLTAWQSFRYAMLVILVIEPHAIGYPGAYLSFLAVGILMLVPKIFPSKKWWMHLVTQVCCLIGLSPLTVLWFSSIPVTGIVANFLAIPWVSWIVLPLAFSMSVFLGEWGRVVFDISAQCLYQGLQFIQHFQQFNFHCTWPNHWMAWYAMMVLLVLIIYPHWKTVILGLLGFIGIGVSPHIILKQGEYLLDVLNVGQGLSVLIRTKNHALLYDTAGMQGKKTLGQLVVLPYLKYIQLKKLDMMVLSHPDLDHIAGRHDISARFPNAKWVVDKPSFYHRGKDCRQLKDWCWDGVCFHFYKSMKKTKKKNNHSCVLEVMNSKHHVLLTGDIEKKAEQAILKERKKSPLSVLLVPHHGSKTSSTESFLKALKPEMALVSVALYNSYHLPHPMIKKRYEQYHIPWISTAEKGLIQLKL